MTPTQTTIQPTDTNLVFHVEIDNGCKEAPVKMQVVVDAEIGCGGQLIWLDVWSSEQAYWAEETSGRLAAAPFGLQWEKALDSVIDQLRFCNGMVAENTDKIDFAVRDQIAMAMAQAA